MAYLTGPVERHIRCWPENHAQALRRELDNILKTVVKNRDTDR